MFPSERLCNHRENTPGTLENHGESTNVKTEEGIPWYSINVHQLIISQSADPWVGHKSTPAVQNCLALAKGRIREAHGLSRVT